jgi:hypothetical protein
MDSPCPTEVSERGVASRPGISSVSATMPLVRKGVREGRLRLTRESKAYQACDAFCILALVEALGTTRVNAIE